MTDRIDTAAEREKLAELRKYKLAHGEPEYRSQMLVRPGGAWVPVSIHRSTVYRLLDAIDAEQARAEKAEVERDVLRQEVASYHDAYEQAKEGRDQALARLAAAYEMAANVARSHVYYDSVGSGFRVDEFDDAICTLSPADAEAALQRTVDAEWNDAVEAAARIASIFGQGRQGMQASRAIEQAIRDLKRQHNRE